MKLMVFLILSAILFNGYMHLSLFCSVTASKALRYVVLMRCFISFRAGKAFGYQQGTHYV